MESERNKVATIATDKFINVLVFLVWLKIVFFCRIDRLGPKGVSGDIGEFALLSGKLE
jgi:hypothetical protein